MGIIGQIRERGGSIAVGLIGVSMVMFLLMDALGSKGSQSTGNGLGTVNGYEITAPEYEQTVQEMLDNYQRNGMDVSDEMRSQVSEQAWNQIVEEKIQKEQFEKLGIEVTDAEMERLLITGGENLHPSVKSAQIFQDNGQFSRKKMEEYIKSFDGEGGEDRRQQWAKFEKSVLAEQTKTKYTDLIKKALYIPKWYAEKTYADQNKKVDFNYVMIPYSSINDADVKISDSDLKSYISKNAGLFKQEESRSVKFVSFPINASAADSANASKVIANALEGFKTTEDSKIESYLRVSESDTQFDSTYQTKEQVTSPYVKDTLFKLPVGSVVGPYNEAGAYKVARILSRKTISDSIQIRDMVIQGAAEVAKKRADSLIAAIRGGSSFDTLAKKFSAIPEAKIKGGNSRYVKPGDLNAMAPQINYAAFYKYGNGDLFKVELPNGVVYIGQITNAGGSKEAVKVAYLTKNINPSEATVNGIYAQAQDFLTANPTLKSLEANAPAKGLQIREGKDLNQNAARVEQLSNASPVVAWAFNAGKVGETANKVFQVDEKLPDGRGRSSYAVVALSEQKAKGIATVDNVRDRVKAEVLKEKKAEKIIAKIGTVKDLASLASGNGQQVMSAAGVTFAAPSIENVGREPKVQAAVCGLKANELSKPLVGNMGVFVVQPTMVGEAPAAADIAATKTGLLQPLQQGVDYGLFQAIKKTMDVEDNRYKTRGY
jgi:peptidyl-prolyl cis-trans isomerase D